MKIKLSKVLGVAISLAMLLSLMAVATPAAAAPGDLTYGITSTPSQIGNVLQARTDVDFLLAAPDGTTMFAWDSANGTGLYKSTNAGVTWTQTSVNTGSVLTGTIVDMAISPNYATDSAVVAVTAAAAFLSTNGGKTFTSMAPTDLAVKLEGGVIRSVDIANYNADNTLSIIIGATNAGAGTYSNVLKFKTGGFTWGELSSSTNSLDAVDVIAVAFSPAHMSDHEILAVTNDGATDATHLNTVYGTNAWNANIAQVTLLTAANATGAVFGFGSDYNGLSTNTILIGTSGSAKDDVIRVSNLALGATAVASDRNIKPATGTSADTDNDIKSIAVSGTLAAGDVLVGLTDSNLVYRSSTVAATTTTWKTSGKDATGAANAIVLLAGGNAYVGTTGTDSAVSKSTDGGANFNQVSMIDVFTIANMSLVTSEIVNDNTIFVIMANASGGGYDATSLFRTTDAGATWQGISTGTALQMVEASPAYATDSTIYVASTGSALLQKSTNGGDTFSNIGAPSAVTALAVIDGSTYYTGHAAGFYKSGLWKGATGLQAAANVVSIDVSGSTIITGNSDGDVYISTNDGGKFTRVGADDSHGNGASVIAIFDKDFATNSTIYAGSSSNTNGIKRATGTATTSSWKQLDDDTNTLIVNGLALSADGTLYAASGTAAKGIRRSLDPLTAVTTVAPTTAPVFESITGTKGVVNTTNYHDHKLTGTTQSPNAVLTNLALVPGSNTLYVIDTVYTEPSAAASQYGYTGRLLGIKDTLTGSPESISPANGSELTTTTTATLNWGTLTTADTYSAIYSTSATVPSTSSAATVTHSTQKGAVTALTPGKTYYWKARVATPLLSRYSTISSFIPNLVTPGTGVTTAMVPAAAATDVSTTPALSWPATTGATGYVIQIAEDSTWKILDVSATTTNTFFVAPAPLAYSTTYYWRVRATSGTTDSAWTVGIFTTAAKPAPPAKAIEFPEPLPPVEVVESTIVIEQPAETEIQIVEIEKTVTVPVTIPQPIPSYLLWTIIVIGAVLIVALIVLIVRTRRVA